MQDRFNEKIVIRMSQVQQIEQILIDYEIKRNSNLKDTLICRVPFIYDKTAVDENLKLIDRRYVDYYSFFTSLKEYDPIHLFRGMSGQEFNEAVKRGFFESNKSRNIPGQPNVTYYAQDFQTALLYTNFKSGWRERPAFDKPNYVIKVKRKGLHYFINKDEEAGVKGAISVNKLFEVWEIRLLASECNDIKKASRMTGVRKFSENEIEALC